MQASGNWRPSQREAKAARRRPLARLVSWERCELASFRRPVSGLCKPVPGAGWSCNAWDQTDSPSIAYWRDHSAGASRRRVTPIPRGNRPSMAPCTSLGARNASDIVILTWRRLHCSRAAICSTVSVPATISSSQRRPRAIDATSVARVSARIGRASCGAADWAR